ncbi:MAG: hypothetical protein U5K81_10565 [Trueperaceae bacterium]|nr:hypothetical protein [Trueperaceae bacterium]
MKHLHPRLARLEAASRQPSRARTNARDQLLDRVTDLVEAGDTATLDRLAHRARELRAARNA